MKTAPVLPARIGFDADGTPRSPDFDDLYHARAGALPQARHVFLAGNGLPARWAGRARFVVLETGFGLGNNFLATWDAWRSDPARCEQLYFLSVDKHPPRQDDLREVHRGSPLPALADALVQAWPVLAPGLHPIDFDDGRVHLHLAWGEAEDWLPQWQAQVDAFYLDGFAPARNPALWSPRLLERLGRLAAPQASAATWSVARVVHDGLQRAGFEARLAPGFAGKREMTVATHRPRHTPPRPPGAVRTPRGDRAALVLGAGLAGSAAAWALARQGWQVTVLDRGSHPACAASGQAGGLFHGTFHPDDGPHTRWHRAASLRMAAWARPEVASGALPGAVEGLLRLDERDDDAARQALARSGLPERYLQWWPRPLACERAGLALPGGAWFYPEAGWLDPAAVCRRWLGRPGVDFIGGVEVEALARTEGRRWTACSRDGRAWTAAHLVVATALEAPPLLAPWLPAGWLQATRGQTTLLPADTPGLRPPRLPLAGRGYALGLPDGRVLCGATTQPADLDPGLRDADHAHNLAQFERLTGCTLGRVPDPAGRVGWRASGRDRLPLVGPLPAQPFAVRSLPLHRRPRQMDEDSGLYLLTGLGSRGLGSALLAAEVLASWITGTPCPVEADLRDAIDVARCFTAEVDASG